MTGTERRARLLELLRASDTPRPGSALGKQLGVSRQIVVQDIALLRSQGNEIVSTNRGYLAPAPREDAWASRPERIFKVRHAPEQAEEELTCIVDLGGCVEDISVNHRFYGRITAPLAVRSRRDVARFLEEMHSGVSTQLSAVTDGYHFHRITAETEEALDEIAHALAERGFAAEVLPYEEEELQGRSGARTDRP